jgi:hypothetical protein
VVAQLLRDDVVKSELQSHGVAASEPLRKEENEEARQYNRSVTFRVRVAQGAAGAASRMRPASPLDAPAAGNR